MLEMARSRNPSSPKSSSAGLREDEKEFLAKLKKDYDSPPQDAKLKVKIRPLKSHRSSGITICLMREDDPAFYYVVDITETDYNGENGLRKRQGFLVDFEAFPSMIFSRLDDCIAEETVAKPKLFPCLEFNDLRGDEVTFEIQEENYYKRLAHLSLKLRKGDDAKVREHLGECLKQLKSEHQRVIDQLEDCQKRLEETQRQNENLQMESEKLRKDSQEQSLRYQHKLASDVQEARETASKHFADMTKNYEAEKRKLTEEHALAMRALENRAASLDYDNRDLTEKKVKSDALINRLNDELRIKKEEVQKMAIDLDRRQREFGNENQAHHEALRIKNNLEMQMQVALQDKERLERDLQKRDELVQDLSDQRRRLNEELGEQKNVVNKRTDTIKNVSLELLKAKDIIKQLQEENWKQNDRVKKGCQIVKKQTEIIEVKSHELEEIRKELKDKTEEVIHQENVASGLHKKLEDAEVSLRERDHNIETKQRTIEWLNGQLTNVQKQYPTFRVGRPPEGFNLGTSTIMPAPSSTSTPVQGGPRPQKENKNPSGLDPKLLEPSPALRRTGMTSATARKNNTATTPKGGGLIRQNLSPRNLSAGAGAPASVYFAQT